MPMAEDVHNVCFQLNLAEVGGGFPHFGTLFVQVGIWHLKPFLSFYP